ncbi:MAG: FAD-dependent oxidoreductase [Myxococcota bacterium]
MKPVHHDPPAGADRVPEARSVVVAGGGLAGLAAATVLAERGVKVTVIERERFLGGRAASWPDTLGDGSPFQMERGFHAFFRHYYNLRALMTRVDPELSTLMRLQDYPVFGPGRCRESFSGLPGRAPFNVAALVRRTSTLGLRDLARVSAGRALEMVRFHPERTYARWDGTTAEAYLDSLRFPPRARQMLFEVFAHSFFNPEDDFSAAELLMQFHFYFMGNPEGLVFDVMDRPFGRGLFEPLAAYLSERGVDVHTGTGVEAVHPRAGGGFAVVHGAGVAEGDGVVLALAVPGLREVIGASPQLGPADWRAAVEGLPVTLPFAVWRLWLDRPCAPERPPFAGTAGAGLLDNISVYEKIEDESRAWAERHGGSVVELHAYGVPADLDEGAIRRGLLEGLHRLYPETRQARAVDERFLLRRDCPGFPPGAHARRPGVQTPVPGLCLAGDFVRMPFPSALMERATASGFVAANHLLAGWRTRGEPLVTVPPTGLLARAPNRLEH